VAFLFPMKRITSFRQREQQVQQRAQRLRQQQEREQMRQQPVRVQQREQVQERGFLFCHRQPKQQPSERPRGVIFS
jgi:hypothetical protein